MLNLKQAYSYLSTLNNNIEKLNCVLYDVNFVYDLKVEILKSLVSETESNVIEEEPFRSNLAKFDYNRIISVLESLLQEYQRLLYAIDSYKDSVGYIAFTDPITNKSSSLSIDDAIKYNSRLREYADAINQALQFRNKEVKGNTSTYVKGQDGPVQVMCPTISHYTVRYDTKMLEDKLDEILTTADELSAKIDELMSKDIGFEPAFSRYKNIYSLLENTN